MPLLLFFPVLTLLVLLAMPGRAQDGAASVADQLAADNQPTGGRIRQFLVLPRVDVQALYNDNIYAQRRRRVSDEITRLRPGVVATSDWNRHALSFSATGDFARYATHRREDTNDFDLHTEGRLDVRRGTYLNAGAGYTQDHENRGDPNTPLSAVAPTVFTTTSAHVGATRELGRLRATLDSRVEDVNYRDNQTTTGQIISNSLRDRTRYVQTLRLGYVVRPGIEPYVKGALDDRIYDAKVPLDRSSHGGDAVAGATVVLTGKLTADVHAGYTLRHYAAPLGSVSTPVAGAAVTWQVDGLTTARLGIDRSVEETIVGSNSADIRSAATVGVEHALTRYWLVHGEGGYAHHTYRGGAPRVNENFFQESFGTTYYLNRWLALGADYTRIDRQISAVAGETYSQNVLLVHLQATY